MGEMILDVILILVAYLVAVLFIGAFFKAGKGGEE